MSEIAQVLEAIDGRKPQATRDLLPVFYDELRRLAARKLPQEKPGQTLDATALVHEASMRLAPTGDDPGWADRRRFFAATAEAMRRILVENARRKGA